MQKSAWFVLHRLCFIVDEDAPEPLDKEIIEIDETYIGGKFAK
jgi:hypothetical protein